MSTPNNNNNNNDDNPFSWNQIQYSLSSFHAIITPVSISMILSAVSVLYVSTADSRAATQQALTSTYTIFSVSSSSSVSTSLGKGLVNSIVIVSVIAAMTFVIVLLYKYHCMKFLWTYMILSSALLLGFLGYQFVVTGLQRYHIPLDVVTLYYSICNFCISGVLVIFFAQHKVDSEMAGAGQEESSAGSFLISIIGSPRFFTQAYLIATSVILAWQLSNFEEWTTWTLLVLLALYDLCAVLTPCGPLKMLVGLMQKSNAPALPGLLYEAPLPRRDGGGGVGRRRTTPSSSSSSTRLPNGQVHHPRSTSTSTTDTSTLVPSPPRSSSSIPIYPPSSSSLPTTRASLPSPPPPILQTSTNIESDTPQSSSFPNVPHRERIPLAIARVYTLPILDVSEELHERVLTEWTYRRNRTRPTSSEMTSTRIEVFTPTELQSLVQVEFPSQGGRILPKEVPIPENNGVLRRLLNKGSRRQTTQSIEYHVLDRHGIVKRILVVDEDTGQVFVQVQDRGSENDEESVDEPSSTIKLGLGDFIFYSVLVAKAVLHSFTTFTSCMLVILSGLGGTLVLLSVYHHALPALPISIFLGVIFYILTRIIIEPWIKVVLTAPLFV